MREHQVRFRGEPTAFDYDLEHDPSLPLATLSVHDRAAHLGHVLPEPAFRTIVEEAWFVQTFPFRKTRS